MTTEQFLRASEIIESQESNPLPAERQTALLEDQSVFWDVFYRNHEQKFFKDRKWLEIEFRKELVDFDEEMEYSILEVGCGVGNTVFPLLEKNKTKEKFFVHACDFSETAIAVLKSNPEYNNKCNAFVHDITKEFPLKHSSVDVITMIFVLSAIHPTLHRQCLENAFKILKPGGLLLFRDYGKMDLVQLRFKKSNLEPGLYARGDDTLVYFFELNETAELMKSVGFEVEQNVNDKRLLVNRKLKLEMHRIWIQGKYRKPLDAK